MRSHRLAIAIVSVAITLASIVPLTAHEPAGSGVIRIGMPQSMFRDVNPAVFAALSKPFYALVESQTGLKSDLLLVPTPDEMREQLDTGKIQFAVFHGFEFAWMKQKSPTLQPVMLAAPTHKPLRSLLVVSQECTCKELAELKGKSLAIPKGTREYTRLFIHRKCQTLGQSAEVFFGQVTTPATPETALNDVVDGKVQSAIVDGATLAGFAERYSGRSKRIKVLVASEVFPEGVVAYRPGMIDDEVVRRFRQGMTNAHTTPMGRQLLSLWSMAGFQQVPPNYSQQLADCLKAYPPPTDENK